MIFPGLAEHVRVLLLLPARDGLELGLGKQKLRVGGHRVALIGADQLSVQCLCRVLAVVKSIPLDSMIILPLLIWLGGETGLAITAPPFR